MSGKNTDNQTISNKKLSNRKQ